ncbi:MAG: hypothetical protein ACAI38_24950 [Myxococcota bacterium]|nr:hypothetical protein [Myxococcota bacterium]
MDSLNPYAAPAAQLVPEVVAVTEGSVGGAVVEELGASKSWLAGMGAFGIAASCLMMGTSAFRASLRDEAGLHLVAFVLAALYVAPAIALLRTAGAVKRLGGAPTGQNLAEVTRRLATFWRLAGVITAAAVGVTLVVNFFMRMFLRAV